MILAILTEVDVPANGLKEKEREREREGETDGRRLEYDTRNVVYFLAKDEYVPEMNQISEFGQRILSLRDSVLL